MENKDRGLWLNLGCSDNVLDGFLNVDKFYPKLEYNNTIHFPFLEADLEKEWPWKASTVDYILAKDIIEHLPDKIFTMNEAWTVMKPGALMHIEVPTTDGRGAFQDPTHVSFWNRNSFFYFEDGNPHRERFGDAYGIVARFKIVTANEEMLADQVSKLTIVLEAVK